MRILKVPLFISWGHNANFFCTSLHLRNKCSSKSKRFMKSQIKRDKNRDYPIISYSTSPECFDTSGERRRKMQNSHVAQDHFKRVAHKNRDTDNVHMCISLLLVFHYSLPTIPVLPHRSFPSDNPILLLSVRSNERNVSRIFTSFRFIKIN